MKKFLYIFFSALLIPSLIYLVVIRMDNLNKYCAYKGIVQGTNFYYQELPVGQYYDVDSAGKIYIEAGNAIQIYNADGVYLYSLLVNYGGYTPMAIQIDENENIMVYKIKEEQIEVYNTKGQLIKILDGNSQTFFNYNVQLDSVKNKPNGIVYNYDNGTITKTINGEIKTVYNIPAWQKELSLNDVYLGLIIAGLFLLNILVFVLPHAIKIAEIRRIEMQKKGLRRKF